MIEIEEDNEYTFVSEGVTYFGEKAMRKKMALAEKIKGKGKVKVKEEKKNVKKEKALKKSKVAIEIENLFWSSLSVSSLQESNKETTEDVTTKPSSSGEEVTTKLESPSLEVTTKSSSSGEDVATKPSSSGEEVTTKLEESPSLEVEIEYSDMEKDEEEEERFFFLITKEEEEKYLDLELSLENFKNGNRILRSKNKNKHEKINVKRYINSRDNRREESYKSYLCEHYSKQKYNRSIGVAKEISLLNSGRRKPSSSGAANNSTSRSRNNNIGLPDEVFQALERLQWKQDLTPEDYDLLLRLDETVKPKTVASHKMRSIAEVPITQEDVDQSKVCMICLELFSLSNKKKSLPCGHEFHAKCIDYWLLNSSDKCPLDGLAVFPS